MHHQIIDFIEKVADLFPSYIHDTKVLDVGSRNVNGTNKWAFRGCEYIGIDICAGNNVDIQESVVQHSKAHEGEYHVVICTEMLEHDREWSESMKAMLHCLKSHGLLVITCAGPGRAEHGTHGNDPQDSPMTNDYYRNLTQLDFMEHFGNGEMLTFAFEYGRGEKDCYFWGIKR